MSEIFGRRWGTQVPCGGGRDLDSRPVRLSAVRAERRGQRAALV